MAAPHPPSPCTNLCTINPETDICDGCGRTLDEIAEWGWMTPEQKLEILRRINRTSGITDESAAE